MPLNYRKIKKLYITTNGMLLGNKKELLLNAKPQISDELSLLTASDISNHCH